MKRFQGDLISLSNLSGANTRTRGVTIPSGATTDASFLENAYIFPTEWYPLDSSCQIVLLWRLYTLPTNATYVQVTPFTFEGILRDVLGNAPVVAVEGGSGANDVIAYLWQFDELDTTNNRVTPHRYTIRKTATDLNIATNESPALLVGTRHALPIAAGEYVGFAFEHDGTNNTGRHDVSAVVSWS